MADNTAKFAERLQRTETAIHLGTPDRVPCIPFTAAISYFLSDDGTTYKDAYYNQQKAADTYLRFLEKHQQLDAALAPGLVSGKAQELAGTNMIDWPGRPGTAVPDWSSHQAIEHEYITTDEYKELIDDYTGFMIRKYIPRAYPNLAGLAGIRFNPSIILSTGPMASFMTPDALGAYKIFEEMSADEARVAQISGATNAKAAEMGFPPFFSGAGEVPFDIISDYFRGTLAAAQDLIDCPDLVEAACNMLVDVQIAGWEYFKFVPMPVKRVFFPLHKAMDNFMSPEQFDKIYWAPFMKLVDYLISIDVTPIVYTEGPYNTHLDRLSELPEGKCIVHFENVDMKKAKETVGKVACITGDFPVNYLSWESKEKCIDYVKYLIDTCAPGGGYIFDTNASIDDVKPENFEAMIDTVIDYGKY